VTVHGRELALHVVENLVKPLSSSLLSTSLSGDIVGALSG
jgi:hypothetical protein